MTSYLLVSGSLFFCSLFLSSLKPLPFWFKGLQENYSNFIFFIVVLSVRKAFTVSELKYIWRMLYYSHARYLQSIRKVINLTTRQNLIVRSEIAFVRSKERPRYLKVKFTLFVCFLSSNYVRVFSFSLLLHFLVYSIPFSLVSFPLYYCFYCTVSNFFYYILKR